jgi:hypothetical protein
VQSVCFVGSECERARERRRNIHRDFVFSFLWLADAMKNSKKRFEFGEQFRAQKKPLSVFKNGLENVNFVQITFDILLNDVRIVFFCSRQESEALTSKFGNKFYGIFGEVSSRQNSFWCCFKKEEKTPKSGSSSDFLTLCPKSRQKAVVFRE